jgi:hypothetical protein
MQLFVVATTLIAALATVAVAQPGCPVNPPGGGTPVPPPPAANCQKFCSGECAYHPDYSPLKPVNITVFRLTAKKMLSLGVANKNTGDARGDVEFYMGRFLSLVNCTPPGPGTTFSSTRSL